MPIYFLLWNIKKNAETPVYISLFKEIIRMPIFQICYLILNMNMWPHWWPRLCIVDRLFSQWRCRRRTARCCGLLKPWTLPWWLTRKIPNMYQSCTGDPFCESYFMNSIIWASKCKWKIFYLSLKILKTGSYNIKTEQCIIKQHSCVGGAESACVKFIRHRLNHLNRYPERLLIVKL